MGLVDRFVEIHVAEAKIGRQIDDPAAGGHQVGDDGHGQLVGQGGEDDIGCRHDGPGIESLADQVYPSRQRGKDIGKRHPGVLARGDHGECHGRVTGQDANEFGPGVAGGADDGGTGHGCL